MRHPTNPPSRELALARKGQMPVQCAGAASLLIRRSRTWSELRRADRGYRRRQRALPSSPTLAKYRVGGSGSTSAPIKLASTP